MAQRSCTTIAAILLKGSSAVKLEQLADEILQSKIAKRAGSRSITWDCDDLVFLDFDAIRIGLYEIRESQDTPNVICIAVGPVSGRSLPKHIESASLAHGLVKRIGQSIEARAVLWHDDPRCLCPFVIDDFHTELDKMLGYLELQMQGTRTPKSQADSAVPPSRAETINDDAALSTLREKLSASGMIGAPVSLPLHVSLYILAVTFFFMIPALGSTLLSYIWLRDGVDKRSPSA